MRLVSQVEPPFDAFEPFFKPVDSPLDTHKILLDRGQPDFNDMKIIQCPIQPGVKVVETPIETSLIFKNDSIRFFGHARPTPPRH
jgi:hypothetical protein